MMTVVIKLKHNLQAVNENTFSFKDISFLKIRLLKMVLIKFKVNLQFCTVFNLITNRNIKCCLINKIENIEYYIENISDRLGLLVYVTKIYFHV